jgi:outer membrane protein OmpA-like peptidoglycan-associated protein
LKHNFLLRGYFKNRGYEDSSDLAKDEIVKEPDTAAVKEFTLQAKQMFDKQDSAKLKNEKQLNAAGEFLAANEFGVAVVEISTGSAGDSEKQLQLSQGRALVVRDYLVQHFGFDDTKLKTVALGKQSDVTSKDGWGLIKILVYPEGTPMPAAKTPAAANPAAPKK